MHQIAVRSKGKTGHFLFAWEPDENIIDIVRKNMCYRVKLYNDGIRRNFQVIDEHPKDSEIEME